MTHQNEIQMSQSGYKNFNSWLVIFIKFVFTGTLHKWLSQLRLKLFVQRVHLRI